MYYRSQGCGATWCPGIFQKKKKTADRPLTAPFDLRADIHRSQTTPFFGLVQYPPPESSYCLLYQGSNATAHIPRKLSSFCALSGGPSLAKAPAKLSWTTIWTLLLISSPAPRLCCHLSCAPLTMRLCATLSHVLMATAMSKHISSDWGGPSDQSSHKQPCPCKLIQEQEQQRKKAGAWWRWMRIPPPPWRLQFVQFAAKTENHQSQLWRKEEARG